MVNWRKEAAMAVLIKDKQGMTEHNKYRYWAERGMIHWEHIDTGDYGNQSVRTTLVRLRGIQDMLKNAVPDSHESGPKMYYHDEVESLQSWIEEMVELIREAQRQGMPSDASAVRAMKRRRKKTVVMPGTRAMF
jgi:predicted RNA-binding protein with PUA-like domain